MWWDNAWDDAPAGAASFFEQLRLYERQAGNIFSQGSLASVGKNSANQSYRGPGIGSFTPAQIQVGWRTLINLYRDISAEITLEVGPPTDPQVPAGGDTEANIYARGQLLLSQVVTEYQGDVTDLLLPPTLTSPQQITIP